MEWAYGVTTVPSRIVSGLLETTLLSLRNAGFTHPKLYIDGAPPLAVADLGLEVTCRVPAVRIYGNFHMGLTDLMISNPKADRYAMFQDDFVTYHYLRDYLESLEYPKDGYWNLYTFPENEREHEGWYYSPTNLGKGAVALIFDQESARALINCPRWINRAWSNPKNKDRLWKCIDGGIMETMKLAGRREMVHNPSLVQHTGKRSSIANHRQPLARTFRGEQFDARRLICRSKESA